MKSVQIKGSVREQVGKRASEALKAQGLVPSVLYGGESPIHFSASVIAFGKVVNSPEAFIIELDLDGKVYKAILQDAQYHPISDVLIHADLLLVKSGAPVTIMVPVQTVGNSKGVLAGGKLQTILKKLKVKALSENLPDYIQVDMTNVDLGGSVQVKDIAPVEGVEILNVPNAVVARVQITRSARMAAAAPTK